MHSRCFAAIFAEGDRAECMADTYLPTHSVKCKRASALQKRGSFAPTRQATPVRTCVFVTPRKNLQAKLWLSRFAAIASPMPSIARACK